MDGNPRGELSDHAVEAVVAPIDARLADELQAIDSGVDARMEELMGMSSRLENLAPDGVPADASSAADDHEQGPLVDLGSSRIDAVLEKLSDPDVGAVLATGAKLGLEGLRVNGVEVNADEVGAAIASQAAWVHARRGDDPNPTSEPPGPDSPLS